jgi:hypothetical protein
MEKRVASTVSTMDLTGRVLISQLGVSGVDFRDLIPDNEARDAADKRFRRHVGTNSTSHSLLEIEIPSVGRNHVAAKHFWTPQGSITTSYFVIDPEWASPAELRVACLLARGFSRKAIADRLHITVKGVHKHAENLGKRYGLEPGGVHLTALVGQLREAIDIVMAVREIEFPGPECCQYCSAPCVHLPECMHRSSESRSWRRREDGHSV